MTTIQVGDQTFQLYLSETDISARVKALAEILNTDYQGKNPLFIGILNGVFMFIADLFKHLTIDAELGFVRLSSYQGMQSSGDLHQKMGLDKDLANRDVIVVDDIIDTGNTLSKFVADLQRNYPTARIKVLTLLSKPSARKVAFEADYVGFEIPNVFVVGYGLDYDECGRQWPAIYQLYSNSE